MPYKTLNARRQYHKDYWAKNKHIKKEKGRQYWLKSKYNITPKDYDEMLEKQNHRCALCNKHVSELERRLAVDHCHDTGIIRGLLCMPCNTSLGQLGDTPKAISKILSYLTQNTGV